ncbi:MAG: SRPBCC family protein [Candidatus Dormibacteraeota bacterium]|uniref:SRPBCC family protein n=1 Tax=Candidatus Amunia macphersoniae TaxID=3127014 RepID=A0A934NFE7_9BACT|nr:SRPBCC family protein [Candidatus Dormibacteraeota bacterium]
MATVTVETHIGGAFPAAVYDLVADLPRMGEWSPECERVEWTGATAAPVSGAQFTGHNRLGGRHWSTHGTVTVAERGREFTFEIRSVLNLPVALWRYRFEARDGGCRVIESTEDRRGGLIRLVGRLATGVGDRPARNRETMTVTLERLRAAVEKAGATGGSPRHL